MERVKTSGGKSKDFSWKKQRTSDGKKQGLRMERTGTIEGKSNGLLMERAIASGGKSKGLLKGRTKTIHCESIANFFSYYEVTSHAFLEDKKKKFSIMTRRYAI